MTTQQINEAIARAGPQQFKIIHGKAYWADDGGLVNFTNDLNAMHVAEGVLPDEQYCSYDGTLLEIVSRDYRHHCTGKMLDRASTHATARQRAEAFLRTLGKWEGA